MSSSQVIVVDLDGTLTSADTILESLLLLVRNKPYLLLILPFWLIKGVEYFRAKIAENSSLDVTTLPYNMPFINWLKEQKVNGKKIVLYTETDECIAKAITKHLEIFDDLIFNEKYPNLKNNNKDNTLQELYGNGGYDYAGSKDTKIDFWTGASGVIVVNAKEDLLNKVSRVAPVVHTFPKDNIGILDWIKALRVHQWLKNLLLFVPLLASHQFDNTQFIVSVFIAFISFSLSASAVYIINDLFDLESDRIHPSKKYRPFASAKLQIKLGLAVALLLISLSIVLGSFVGVNFSLILLLYLLITLAYSLLLKRTVLLDCITLATLYTTRIIAGAVALSLPLSFWLLAFSVFIFLSLALVKRYAELVVQKQAGNSISYGRGYVVSDAPLIQQLGISSGYISTLIIALYVNTEYVASLYAQPQLIWFIIPIVLFWVSWVWLKAARGEMQDDPVIFAIKDKTSLVVVFLIIVVFVFATIGISFND